MDMKQSDFDHEHALKTAEAEYAKNPLDADNLTRWARVLLDLSPFQTFSESQKMNEDAILKLEQAIIIDPKRHHTLWCLGEAYTSQALLIPHPDEAKVHFVKAAEYFQKAVDQDPGNELYQKSLELSHKVPVLHAEIHKHGGLAQQQSTGAFTFAGTKTEREGEKDVMDLEHSDLDHEDACKIAEAEYAKNPLDADNLTRWARALLDLSPFQTFSESQKMNEDAILKLEQAIIIDPKRHHTLWCLGEAYTSQALLIPHPDEAKVHFVKAAEYFQKAVDQDPGNELYQKSLELSHKVPVLHAEIDKHGGLAQQQSTGAFTFAGTKTERESEKDAMDLQQSEFDRISNPAEYVKNPLNVDTREKKKSSYLRYDVFGWIILAVGIVACVRFAKSNLPPPPPSP